MQAILVKIIGAFVTGSFLFFSGFYVAQLQGERNLADYKLQTQDAQNAIRKKWEGKLAEAESALADLRRSESVARAESDKLRQRVAGLQRRAKTAEAEWGVRLADLATRREEHGKRAETALRFCAKILH